MLIKKFLLSIIINLLILRGNYGRKQSVNPKRSPIK